MRNLKKLLISLGAAAAIAALATVGTFAGFTDSESISGNNFDSGSVEVDLNDGSTNAVVTVSNMVIGDTKSGSLKVENDGDNKASFTLKGSATGDSALLSAAKIRILDGTTEVLAPTSLSTFNSGSGYSVGALPPTGSDSKMYTIELSLPSQGSDSADNALQSLSASETFTVDAAQRAGANRDTNTTPEN